ncbi:MAG: FkbM family methyltransferase [Ahniella sp.]|nr:FkbM family methyltransferase [Ahniella sp.]
MSFLDRLFLQLYRRKMRGAVRLAGWLGIGGNGGRLIRIRTRYGSRFDLDPFEYIDSHVLREGFYESEVFEAALGAMPQNGMFWDVGANIGLHAVSMAHCLPGSRCVAFEPSPREFVRLARSIELNSGRVQALPLGLSDQEALLPFHVCQTNSGRNGLHAWGEQSMYTTTLASIARADDLVDRGLLDAPNVVKIDVEGAELAVLQGMTGILARPECRAIVIEAGLDALSREHPINILLTNAGFQMRRLERREQTSHDLDNFIAERVACS